MRCSAGPGFTASLRIPDRAIRQAPSRRRSSTVTTTRRSSTGRSRPGASPGLRMVFTEHGRLSDGPPSTQAALGQSSARPASRIGCSPFRTRCATTWSSEGFPANRSTSSTTGSIRGRCRRRRIARRAARLNLPDDRFVVGPWRGWTRSRTCATLVDAFARVRWQHAAGTLVLVGDGEERAAPRGRRARDGVQPRSVSSARATTPGTLLPAFDVYVNSSSSEGVSLTILEAMAAGRRSSRRASAARRKWSSTADRPARAVARSGRRWARRSARWRSIRRAARRSATRRAEAVEQRFTLDRMVDDYARDVPAPAGLN